MRLFVLRHAQAEIDAPDRDRILSEIGRAQIVDLCSKLSQDDFFNVAHVWHSPYARAAQTARLFCEEMCISAPFLEINNATPDSDPRELAHTIASISQFGADLILVTHNPFAEKLSDLLLGCPRGSAYFNKCTLACFQLSDDPSPENPFGSWAISMLISPSILA